MISFLGASLAVAAFFSLITSATSVDGSAVEVVTVVVSRRRNTCSLRYSSISLRISHKPQLITMSVRIDLNYIPIFVPAGS